MTIVSDGDEEPRDTMVSTWPIGAWTRPTEQGNDAVSGPGTAPPGRTEEDVVAYRAVINTAIEQTQDVTNLLIDAASARPGATAQVMVAINSLRIAANHLEKLTHPAAGTPDGPGAAEGAGR